MRYTLSSTPDGQASCINTMGLTSPLCMMVYSNVDQSLQEKDLSCLLYINTFAMWDKLKDKAKRPRQNFSISALKQHLPQAYHGWA